MCRFPTAGRTGRQAWISGFREPLRLLKGSLIMHSRFIPLLLALLLSTAISFGATSKVCVDPGHGGTDSGATGCSLLEDSNNLSMSTYFYNWMVADNNNGSGGGSWNVVRTRTSDVYVSLASRCAISNNNGCNRFMSNHCNACGCGASGTETFSLATTGNGADLRNKIQYRMLNAWGLTNRGNKTANFYVLVYTNASATLAEVGFIDKCSPDAGRIGSSTYRSSAGLAFLYAIQTHYGLGAFKP